jgi:peptide deformylase
LQHEIDHLRGALYIDRMRSRTFTSLENWQRFAKGQPIPADSPDEPKK